jgi:hypothetical protein
MHSWYVNESSVRLIIRWQSDNYLNHSLRKTVWNKRNSTTSTHPGRSWPICVGNVTNIKVTAATPLPPHSRWPYQPITHESWNNIKECMIFLGFLFYLWKGKLKCLFFATAWLKLECGSNGSGCDKKSGALLSAGSHSFGWLVFMKEEKLTPPYRSQINDAMIFFTSGENDVPSNFVSKLNSR